MKIGFLVFTKTVDFGDEIQYSVNIGYEDYLPVQGTNKTASIIMDKDITKVFELKTEQIYKKFENSEEKVSIPHTGIYELILVGGGRPEGIAFQ